MGNTLTINTALTPTLHNDMLIIKEKLDLPPVMIGLSNHYWTDSQSIGKEYELLLALFVQVDDSTYLVRVLLHRQLTGHVADRI